MATPVSIRSSRAMPRSERGRAHGLAAAALLAASLAVFWPGIAMFDTVDQYEQVLDGTFTDWHPPAMARLWALLALLGGGAAPMLVLQMALYWLGAGLLAAALARAGRRRAGWATLAIAAWPPFLGWQAVVLKDAQMTGALLAAAGLAGWWRLGGRVVPGPAVAGIAVLLGYATLVRANAVFATIPFAVVLLPRPRALAGRFALALAGVALAIGVSGPINHRLLGAEPTRVEATQAIYDLGGMAARGAPPAELLLRPGEARAIVARGCATPFFWDPLGEPGHCQPIGDRLRALPVATLYRALALAAVRHPIAYANARLAHWNSTERWWVPLFWPEAAPAMKGEPNDDGLAGPGPVAQAWQRLAGWLVLGPWGWPIAWAAVALWVVAAARPTPAGRLATALAASTLTLEASFAVLSIASDLRYHLWAMIAAALAALLVVGEARWTRAGRAAAILLALVLLSGVTARLILPSPPPGYQAMLTWPPPGQP